MVYGLRSVARLLQPEALARRVRPRRPRRPPPPVLPKLPRAPTAGYERSGPEVRAGRRLREIRAGRRAGARQEIRAG